MGISIKDKDLSLCFSRDELGDTDSLLSKEWLVTNGLGGFASGTLLGVATRRYHGMFVPHLLSPWGRTVIIPRLDEEAVIDGQAFLLSGVEFEDGRLQGDLPQVLDEFSRDGHIPVWRCLAKGRRLEKRVLMPYGQNSVYVEYRLLEGDSIRLRLRPFVTFRTLDAQLSGARRPPCSLNVVEGRYEMDLCEGAPLLKMCLRPHGGLFVADDLLSKGISYRVDKDRGYEHIEDLTSPGLFAVELTTSRPISFVVSTEPWEHLQFEARPLLEAEAQRTTKLLAQSNVGAQDDFERWLTLAADQFIVFPGSRLEEHALARASGDEARTVIAGYHWFTDWGRDTMISLEGLTLCTGRQKEARSILRTFARYIKDGLLPNLFPEGQRQALYHTADATLWFFHAVDRYYRITHDHDTLVILYPVLQSVIQQHVRGTHFGIGVDDEDGLLRAGAEGYQLTWMDAKVDDWVVTPRRGKPVEIQALWYNALRCMAQWAEHLNEQPDHFCEMAGRAERSFNARFWCEKQGYLSDVVDGEQGNDASLRPNQILTLSLQYPILHESKWSAVVDVVADTLLTPVGLRTLSRGHRDYKPRYCGDLRARDAAYHQGTVWAWLIGHYVDAWLKVYKDTSRARAMLDGFKAHLREAGIGTISEIFDADPPFYPRGCIAQAWSVAEVLRAWQKTRKRTDI